MASVAPTSSDALGPDQVVLTTVAPSSNTTASSTGSPASVMGSSGKARSTESSTTANSKAQYVKDLTRALLLWENPLHSAVVLTAILGANYVMTTYSPVNVISFALGAATLANLIFVNAWTYGGSLFTSSTANGGIKKPPTMWFLDNANRQPLSHSFIREWSDLFVDIVNVSISSVASIVAVDDSKKSAEALLAIGAIYLLSCYISSGTLFLIATVIGFVAPRIYLANQTLIDGHINQTRSLLAGHVQNITGKASKYYTDVSAQAKIRVAQNKVKKAE